MNTVNNDKCLKISHKTQSSNPKCHPLFIKVLFYKQIKMEHNNFFRCVLLHYFDLGKSAAEAYGNSVSSVTVNRYSNLY